MIDFKALAEKVMQRCDAVALETDTPGIICRTFCSPAMRSAVSLVRDWMIEAGLNVQLDAACNVVGKSGCDDRPLLLIGSHIDTVPNGGKYDGALGVMFAVAAAEMYRDRFDTLPFIIEAIAFSEEEGVRYRSPYIGSKAVAGCFDKALLDRADDQGVTCRDSIHNFGGDPTNLESASISNSNILGYFEPHIEQGPVLEQLNLAVGIVDGIAGQTRATARFIGSASHAGTTPMHLRKDAMAAAAEWITAVECRAKQVEGLVATVGYVQVTPNVPNVIAGDVAVRLDARHLDDALRRQAAIDLKAMGEEIAQRRGLSFQWERCEEQPAVQMDRQLIDTLEQSFIETQQTVNHMTSGAGHDAVIISQIAPTSMLFLRCKGGISHHPDESIDVKDVEVALQVMYHFIDNLSRTTR